MQNSYEKEMKMGINLIKTDPFFNKRKSKLYSVRPKDQKFWREVANIGANFHHNQF